MDLILLFRAAEAAKLPNAMIAYITAEWDAITFLGIGTFLMLAWLVVELWNAPDKKKNDDNWKDEIE